MTNHETCTCPNCGCTGTVGRGNITTFEWLVILVLFFGFCLLPGVIAYIYCDKLERCSSCKFQGHPVSYEAWARIAHARQQRAAGKRAGRGR